MRFHVGGLQRHAVLQRAKLLFERALQSIKLQLDHLWYRQLPGLNVVSRTLKSPIRENRP